MKNLSTLLSEVVAEKKPFVYEGEKLKQLFRTAVAIVLNGPMDQDVEISFHEENKIREEMVRLQIQYQKKLPHSDVYAPNTEGGSFPHITGGARRGRAINDRETNN